MNPTSRFARQAKLVIGLWFLSLALFVPGGIAGAALFRDSPIGLMGFAPSAVGFIACGIIYLVGFRCPRCGYSLFLLFVHSVFSWGGLPVSFCPFCGLDLTEEFKNRIAPDSQDNHPSQDGILKSPSYEFKRPASDGIVEDKN